MYEWYFNGKQNWYMQSKQGEDLVKWQMYVKV